MADDFTDADLIPYGGHVNWWEFFVWPAFGLLPLFAMLPIGRGWAFVALGVSAVFVVGLLLSLDGLGNRRAWVEGSRV